MSEEPRHTAELDEDLRGLLKRTRRVQVVALAALGLVLVSGFAVVGLVISSQNRQLSTQARELSAACGFFHDLAAVPVRPVPPLKRPSKLSVVLIAHSREAYIGLGCHPEIQPPDPSLVFWARYYGVPVP